MLCSSILLTIRKIYIFKYSSSMVQGGAQGENHIWNSFSNTPPFTHEMGRSGLFRGREQLDLLCPSFFLGLLYDEMCCVVPSILALLLIFLRLRERRNHRFLRALRLRERTRITAFFVRCLRGRGMITAFFVAVACGARAASVLRFRIPSYRGWGPLASVDKIWSHVCAERPSLALRASGLGTPRLR